MILRNQTLLVLLKTNNLTRHLTNRQRQVAGLAYNLGEIKARIKTKAQTGLDQIAAGDGEYIRADPPELRGWQAQGGCADNVDVRELKQRGILLLSMIDGIKKKLLQLDLLELRCRELTLSLGKALEAFRHESGNIHRKIYPFGVFSTMYRSLRRLWGSAYFTLHDMEEIAALGNITKHLLKITDSPII